MLRGITTVSFWADDLAAATAWYTELLGIAPYFERPGYAEFRIGDYMYHLEPRNRSGLALGRRATSSG